MGTRHYPASPVNRAIGSLERLRESKLRELKAIEQAIRHLSTTLPLASAAGEPESFEYRGVGIADAARHWVGQRGAPQSTREIAEALVNRGITTSSRNFVSTVYATLAHAAEFQRTDDGRWTLRSLDPAGRGALPVPFRSGG